MRITLDYCRKCYGFFNKINSYTHWIFIEHRIISWFIVALIIVSCGFIHYDANIKEQLFYPYEAYNELQEIAVTHATDHNVIANFSTLPETIEYNSSVSKEKITSVYSTRGNDRFFSHLTVTVEQTGPNFEQIQVNRNFEEHNYISEFRRISVILFSIIFLLISLVLVEFILIVTSLLNKIGLEERRNKYYATYYCSSPKELKEESKNTEAADDDATNDNDE